MTKLIDHTVMALDSYIQRHITFLGSNSGHKFKYNFSLLWLVEYNGKVCPELQ